MKRNIIYRMSTKYIIEKTYMQKKEHAQLLPENLCLPCVLLFAVCFLSGTRQRATLPCATVKTHGKKNTWQNSCFAVCWHTAKTLPCADTRQRLCRVLFFSHGKVNSLSCVIFGTRQSYNFFSLLTSKLFLSTTYNM